MCNFKRRFLILLLIDLFSLCFTLSITGAALYSLILHAAKALETSTEEVAEDLRNLIKGVASFQGQPIKAFVPAMLVLYLVSKLISRRDFPGTVKAETQRKNSFAGEGNAVHVSQMRRRSS